MDAKLEATLEKLLKRFDRAWRVLSGAKRPYLTAEDYPVLAALWDNEEDEVFNDWKGR